MNLLSILSKRHDDWLRMATKLGSESPEDIVQDMYLRLHKYVKNPERILYEHNEVNTFYVYCTIKNLVINEAREKTKGPELVGSEDIRRASDEAWHQEDYDYDTDEVLDIIESEIDGWYWYDKTLFNIYFFKEPEKSIRKLSEATTISTSSIFNTIKNGKEKIKYRLKEEGKYPK